MLNGCGGVPTCDRAIILRVTKVVQRRAVQPRCRGVGGGGVECVARQGREHVVVRSDVRQQRRRLDDRTRRKREARHVIGTKTRGRYPVGVCVFWFFASSRARVQQGVCRRTTSPPPQLPEPLPPPLPPRSSKPFRPVRSLRPRKPCPTSTPSALCDPGPR